MIRGEHKPWKSRTLAPLERQFVSINALTETTIAHRKGRVKIDQVVKAIREAKNGGNSIEKIRERGRFRKPETVRQLLAGQLPLDDGLNLYLPPPGAPDD